MAMIKFYKKNTKYSPTVSVPRTQKIYFPFDSNTSMNMAIKDQGKSTLEISLMVSTQNNFRLLSIPNKIPDLPNKKAFHNGK